MHKNTQFHLLNCCFNYVISSADFYKLVLFYNKELVFFSSKDEKNDNFFATSICADLLNNN